MRLLSAIFRLGIAAHLFERNQAGARELDVERETLLRLPASVAYLVNLWLGERIASTLGGARRSDQK
jgi:hypothetical protein